jgi:hypothetical protein
VKETGPGGNPVKSRKTPPEARADFFISYAGQDQAWAEWIAWQLENVGLTAILQAWDFQPGENFIERMNQALKATDRTIILLSPWYLASRFGETEWNIAFSKDPTGERGKLIPVRVAATDVPRLLRASTYIDLVGKDQTEAENAILDGISVGRQPLRLRRPKRLTSSREQPRYPGDLPIIFGVPPRNPNFSGRADVLDALSL